MDQESSRGRPDHGGDVSLARMSKEISLAASTRRTYHNVNLARRPKLRSAATVVSWAR